MLHPFRSTSKVAPSREVLHVAYASFRTSVNLLQSDAELPSPLTRAARLRPALRARCPPRTPSAAAAPVSQPIAWGIVAGRHPLPRFPLERGPLGAWPPPPATAPADAPVPALSAIGDEGPVGDEPDDPDAAEDAEPPPPSPPALATFPNPSLD